MVNTTSDIETPFARATIKSESGAYKAPDSFNVSSIVDEGRGRITINLASVTANPDYTLSTSIQSPIVGATVDVDNERDPTTECFSLTSRYIPVPPLPQVSTPIDFKRMYVTVLATRVR